jgi:hypothetical protein
VFEVVVLFAVAVVFAVAVAVGGVALHRGQARAKPT